MTIDNSTDDKPKASLFLVNNLITCFFPYMPPIQNHSPKTGILLLVSGPSGSGKTTLCRRSADEGLASYAISCTTRSPRPGEEHGVNYFFLTVDDFKEKITNNEFLEHANVHGNHYGTLKSEVINELTQGKNVVMDIDVQGADHIRACSDAVIQRALVELFVMPASHEELQKRLTGRGTDSHEVIEQRMINAITEMEHWEKYSYCLHSTDKETDYKKFSSLLLAESLRVSRLV